MNKETYNDAVERIRREFREEKEERADDVREDSCFTKQGRCGSFLCVDVDVDFNAQVRGKIYRSETCGDEPADARFD